MATNLDFKKDIELNLREYLEIIYKRRVLLWIIFTPLFTITAFWAIFILKPKYRASATIIIAPPSLQVMREKGIAIREVYDVTNEVETIQGDAIASKACQYLKNTGERKIDILPAEIDKMLTIYNRSKTQIVDIYITDTNPYRAFFVLKALLAVYAEELKERREKVLKDMYETLTKQLAEKRKEMEVAQNALTNFLLNNEIIAKALEVGTSEIEAPQADKSELQKEPRIDEKYLLLKSQRMDKEAFLGEAKQYQKRDELMAMMVIAKRDHSLVDLSLRETLYEKERALAKLLVTQSEIHPNVIEAKGEVEEAKRKIAYEVDRAIQTIEISVKALKLEEEKLRNIIDVGLSNKMVEYNILKRELDVKKGVYDSFMNELQTLNVTEKLQNTPFLRIAKAPLLPTAPVISKPISAFLAFMLSLLSSCFIVFVVENINISIESITEVENILGLTVLGSIPKWKRRSGLEAGPETGRVILGLVTVKQPKSVMSESFRMLRTNVNFLNTEKTLKSLVITSPNPKEGKSFVAANLAVAMSDGGQRVILVDADYRKPTIHRYFNLENTKGLSNFISGAEPLSDLRPFDTDFANLKVIPSGPILNKADEFPLTSKINELVMRLRQESDMVIIDSPPLLAVSDSLILSAKASGVILVIFANATTRHSASRAKILLKNAGANLLGAILNNVETAEGGYYYSQEYYYADGK
jgi:capsular exopolysaccharide synthesis family protein